MGSEQLKRLTLSCPRKLFHGADIPALLRNWGTLSDDLAGAPRSRDGRGFDDFEARESLIYSAVGKWLIRRAHNPQNVGSNPTRAIDLLQVCECGSVDGHASLNAVRPATTRNIATRVEAKAVEALKVAMWRNRL